MIEKMLGGASASTTTSNGTSCTAIQRKKYKKSSSSRRFNDEQIKSLESVFKMEHKLEPRKKLEMARDLGLHPRQVAIWFQNRRARWKSKQVEQDYTTLKADYDNLTHRFESLKKEKQALLRQLRNLCSQLKEEGISSKLDNLDIMSGSSENEDYHELNGGGNYSSGFSGGPLDQDITAIYSDEEEEDNSDDPIKQCEMIKEEELQSRDINNVQDDDDQVTNFDLGSLFDQSYSNWWDVWSSNS